MAVDLPDFLKSGEKARLIPVAPSGQRERHAASVFMATTSIVEPFAREVFSTVGRRIGQRSEIAAYTEVVFRKGPTDSKIRPDGLLILDTSRSKWTVLIEAKIGNAKVDPKQVEQYIELARANDIDAVITISNELTVLPEHLPYGISPRSNGKVAVYHWSWMRLITIATVLIGGTESFDPEQHFILREMLRYFTHENIGVKGLHRMNADWKPLMTKIHAGGSVQKNDADVRSAIQCWHQEEQDICLLLSRKLNVPVSLQLKQTHKNDLSVRISEDASEFAETKRLTAFFEIPDVAGPIEIVAHCLRRNVICRMRFDAPSDLKRYTSRLNWLLRQLPDKIDQSTALKIFWEGGGTTFATISELIENPSIADIGRPNALPKSFELSTSSDLERKFFGPNSFVEGVEAAIPKFYDDLARHIVAWKPAPPNGPASSFDNDLSDYVADIIPPTQKMRNAVRQGQIDGRAFSIFEDGSIEVETQQGLKWFKNLAALQSFTEGQT